VPANEHNLTVVATQVRRFAPFPFPHTVARPDERMPVELKGAERGRIFVACLLNYDWTLRNVGKSAFNKVSRFACLLAASCFTYFTIQVAPPPLLKALNEMLCELHPLVHFLETSGLVTFAPEDASDEERRAIYMPFDMLKTAYEEWLKAAHIKSDNKWLPEYVVCVARVRALTRSPTAAGSIGRRCSPRAARWARIRSRCRGRAEARWLLRSLEPGPR
jgi:hypothetical protein